MVAGVNVLDRRLPGYMSPEQVLGADIGLASDIFSLGSVLTFAATGIGPFGVARRAHVPLVNPADLTTPGAALAADQPGCPAGLPPAPAHGAPGAG